MAKGSMEPNSFSSRKGTSLRGFVLPFANKLTFLEHWTILSPLIHNWGPMAVYAKMEVVQWRNRTAFHEDNSPLSEKHRIDSAKDEMGFVGQLVKETVQRNEAVTSVWSGHVQHYVNQLVSWGLFLSMVLRENSETQPELISFPRPFF